MRAAFSTLLSAVSVDIGDRGGDADTLFLRAYDSGNSLLGSASGSLAEGEVAMRTLSVTAANIAFIEFGGAGAFGQSNLYSDNLTFTTNAVPEPASWAMLMTGFGLAGAALRRRRAALAA